MNPIDSCGFSHFHIACLSKNSKIVVGFLNLGVDVNRPTDYFNKEKFAGYTPLHFAMIYGSAKIVKILLDHGANVNSRDVKGSTPLHYCAFEGFANDEAVDLLIRFGGADVNSMDIAGQTPLWQAISESDCHQAAYDVQAYIKNNYLSNSEKCAINLLKHGAVTNIINPYFGEGLIARAFYKKRRIFNSILLLAKDLISVGENSFSTLHNFVSYNKHTFEEYQNCMNEIGELLKRGCKINHQDNQGKSALHLAVTYGNHQAVRGLLNFGADINIVDKTGNVPLTLCREFDSNVRNLIISHIKKLNFFKLDIHELNRTPEIADELPTSAFINESNKISMIKIHKSFTFYHFLREQGVRDYPTLPQSGQKVVSDLVHSIDLCKRFPEFSCLIRLQYGKAIDRLQIINDAKIGFEIIIGYWLPDSCTELIIGYLRNSDLRSLIDVSTEHPHRMHTVQSAIVNGNEDKPL